MRSVRDSLAALLFLVTGVVQADDVKWKRVQLDPEFRNEGITAFDVNKDGKIDIVGGEIWYEAPDWHMHEIRPVKKYDGATGYSNSFACFNYDVNADGWNDLICIGFPGVPCHWFENPKGMDTHWKQYEIWHSAANESPQFKDLNADGRPELVMSSETEGIYGYLEVPRPEKCQEKWEFVAVSEAKLPTVTHRYYHGLGVTDVNRDGRNDIVIPHGWWEQPSDLTQRPWKFHAHTLSRPGNDQPFASADIYADDLDLDGDNELIHSSAHAHGIVWQNNEGTATEPKYKANLIDEKFSQTHALNYADINRDGTPDLITGKRFYAHGPKGDPDPMGEVVMFWYEVKKTKGQPPQFIPHKIEEGVDTGVGTQFLVTDTNGDGKLDIVLSNKKGTNLLLQQ